MSGTETTYQASELLFEGRRSLVFRGRRADGAPVLVKQLRGLYPEPADVAWSRREFDILRSAAGPRVLGALDFSVRDGRVWLILEPFDGARLIDLFATSRPSTNEAIDIAVEVAHALAHLHDKGILHKALSPESVLWDPHRRRASLIELGAASTVPREPPLARGAPPADADLRFIAPEQTGRVNRAVDHRSDFYALGCVLYWLLTGEPPFSGDDALDIVHAHIARQPIAPSTRAPSVPEPLSQLVMAMLGKRAEDRYQSAESLLEDLAACRVQQSAGSAFKPRARDVERAFRIEARLYGRAAELGLLRAALDRVAAGARELLLVTGDPGIGKTALVHEVLEHATQRANLATGKFDQVNRDVPYASIVQALRQLLLRIVGEGAAEVERWRARLASAVGDSGRALTELIAELEAVIGPQPALEPVPPEDARRRLDLVFRRFVRALASEANPLVLFLDDLQWADLPSLRLIEALLLDPDVTHLLVLGAYRDVEVGPADPLSRTIDVIREEGARVGLVALGPLASADVAALIAETLHQELTAVAPLARVCLSKTGGNPFYLRRFLVGLHADGLLQFARGSWRWDIARGDGAKAASSDGPLSWSPNEGIAAIERQSVTENVVAFMTRQLHRLPDETRLALQRAACIGTTFDLHTLAALLARTPRETQLALESALSRDLIHPLDDRYWVGSVDADTPDFLLAFAHDRVQQAAHESLTEAEQRSTHLAIGRSLLESSSERQRARRLFDIVGHLNRGLDLVTDEAERLRIAELNLAAGRRALASAAYTTAHRCLQLGVGLLAPSAWSTSYALTLDLHVVAAQAAYLAADNAEMDRLVGAISRHAVSQLDRLRGQEILVHGLTARNDLLGAVQRALDLLEELGFRLPRAPTEADIGAGLGPLMERLGGVSSDAIAALPELRDPRVDAARKLMTGVASAAYLAVPPLLPLLAFELVRSTLDEGISRDSPYGFALLALVLAAVRKVDVAHANGSLAMKMLARWDERSLRVRPTHVFNNMVRFWVDPVRDTLPDLLRNYADGIDTGDIEYGLWTAHCYSYHLYYAGESLDRCDSEIGGMVGAMRHHKQLAPLAVTVPFAQLVENLRVEQPEPWRLTGKHVDEERAMAVHLGSNYRGAVFVLSTCMVMARVFFRRYDEAATIAREYSTYRDGATATMHVASMEFYESLAALAGAQPDLAKIEESRDALAHWASYNAVNFGHWRIAIDAELARVRGDVISALDGFDAAIAHAARYGLVGDEALLNERAALFHLGRGSHRVARSYLLEARQAYERWGASAKVAHLEALHPEMLVGTSSPHAGAGRGAANDLDLEALLRASLALSEEIRQGHLLRKVVAITIQNAAATRGFLVVDRDGSLVVEVGLDADGADLVAPGSPLTGAHELATTVVQYVARTAQQLVLSDAAVDRRFSFDPYLQRSQLSAVLCTPLIHKGRRHGILYLENHLVPGCFSAARLKTVQVLAAQAAVSIENAGLVDHLESRVHERTEALERALEQTRVQHQQLVESQRALVMSDRLAVLGQLVAGVAHELNTPLGAIGASSENVAAAIESMVDRLARVVGAATSEELQSLASLVSTAARAATVLSSRDRRAARRALATDLEQQGISEASRVAEALVDMGVLELSGELRPTLASPSRDDLLGAASSIASLRAGVGHIQEGARRMSRIVFALKSYANPGGRDKYVKASVGANLDTLLTLYAHQFRSGIDVVRDYADDTSIEAMHDRLNQVWTNLIHNALQAMGTQGKLTLRVQPSGDDHLAVSIGDTGPGVPEALRARIFEAFFTTKSTTGGSGLGLSISKDIVDAHGGTISVEGDAGDTRFIVRLPVRARDRQSISPEAGAS
ncbi:MAG: AAA family ATPase [Polyangiaceae bacterium]